MIISADTSFLLSERIEQDVNRFVTFDDRQAELAEDAGLVLG